MSRGLPEKRERGEILGEFSREIRQFSGLGASIFRLAAARSDMTVTDMQVIDMLESGGPATAGQLADFAGLTTGAITGMLNRLEEAGLVRRERDPRDGRRVIVQLVKEKDEMHKISSIFAAQGKAWDEIVARYDDEQLAFLVEFLQRSNEFARQEIVRLREVPESEKAEEVFSAPLGNLRSARLVFATGITRLNLRADDTISELYQARFEGPPPGVKTAEGVVTIRYPRGLSLLDRRLRVAEVALSTAIPWQITLQGGAAEITAELGGLKLAGLGIKGSASSIRIDLPVPAGVVPIHISGSAMEMTVRRPAGVAARAHLKGWVSDFTFDDQTFSYLGNDVQLHSRDYAADAPHYEIEIASSASSVTITTL